jgi:hypothetical protein
MQMAHLLAAISPDDGLYYSVWKPDRPWHSTHPTGLYADSPEDFAWVGALGRMMRAMLTWRERDGDARWDGRVQAMARGLAKIAIYRDNYAYYPDGGHGQQFTYPRSGWTNTREPQSDLESGEGSVLDTIGHVIYGLARWAMTSGDAEALDLAEKITTFAMHPKMWGGLSEEIAVHGGEQGHFHTHPHAHMVGLRGILEYGWAVLDPRVLEFVRRSYENLRTRMIPRTGWFPANGVAANTYAEGCNVGDLVALGIRLSDLGLGDYWEDVDAVTRNLLVEQQIVDADKLRAVAEASPKRAERSALAGQETSAGMPERLVGAYSSEATANSLAAGGVGGCCTANATQGLYFAWEGALRCEGDVAQVNLLINRASRLVDVDSYLPYDGKVLLQNKAARRIAVRILSWIDRKQLRLTVDGQNRAQSWVGSYLVIDDLKPGAAIALTFPISESQVSYTAHHRVWRHERVYTYTFRGSTVVDVSPKETNPRNIPIFERAQMCQGPAPMKRVTRFVPNTVLRQW